MLDWFRIELAPFQKQEVRERESLDLSLPANDNLGSEMARINFVRVVSRLVPFLIPFQTQRDSEGIFL